MTVDTRVETRFLLASELESQVLLVLARAGLGLVHLPEQGGRGSSVVRTLYLSTRQLQTPSSHAVRVRTYPPARSETLSLDGNQQVSLEVKSNGTKTRSPARLEQVTDPAYQASILASSLAEVGNSPLVPIAAMEVTRRYYATRTNIAGDYITVDRDFGFWGVFRYGDKPLPRSLGCDKDRIKVEIKSRNNGDLPLENLMVGLLGIGAQLIPDGFLEQWLRNLYRQALTG